MTTINKLKIEDTRLAEEGVTEEYGLDLTPLQQYKIKLQIYITLSL